MTLWRRYALGALLAIGTSAAAQGTGDFWAQATFLRGKATFRKGVDGEAIALRLGTVLHAGDTVAVEGEGSASFLLNDGSVLVVRPGVPVVLGAASRKQGPSLTDVAKNLSRTLLARQGDNPMLKHLSGLRGEGRNIALAPTRTKVKVQRLGFVWLRQPPVTRYLFTLMGPDGKLYETTVEGTRTEVGAERLTSGATYYWEVRDASVTESTAALGSGSFATLDRRTEERVRALEASIAAAAAQMENGDDSTAAFLAYQIYRENGLNRDALLALESMIRSHPDDEELLHWRRELCREMETDPADISALIPR